MLKKCQNTSIERLKSNMASEQELKKANPLHKEFQIILDEEFKDRKNNQTVKKFYFAFEN